MEEFSTKRLIENPEKSKVTARFEVLKRKLIDDIYKKLNEIKSSDAITVQELND
jgi:hypothetical protein